MNSRHSKFANRTDLRRILREKIEHRIAGGQNELLRAFRLLKRGRGSLSVSPSEFTSVLRDSLEIDMKNSEFRELFRKFDTDGNGVLDYSEFIDEVMNAHKPPIYYGELRQTIVNKKLQHKDRKATPNLTASSARRLAAPSAHRVTTGKKNERFASLSTSTSTIGNRRFKSLEEAFAYYDARGTGVIDIQTFTKIAVTFGLGCSKAQIEFLNQRFGDSRGGIKYAPFLKRLGSSLKSVVTDEQFARNPTTKVTVKSLIESEVRDNYKMIQLQFSRYGQGVHLKLKDFVDVLMTSCGPALRANAAEIIPYIRINYAQSSGMIDTDAFIRKHMPKTFYSRRMPRNQNQPKVSPLLRKLGASNSRNRLTYRLEDDLVQADRATAIMKRLKTSILRKKQDLLRDFRIRDHSASGEVNPTLLLSLFSRHGIKSTTRDLKEVVATFTAATGAFNYSRFFKALAQV